jgi:hypothetical protein
MSEVVQKDGVAAPILFGNARRQELLVDLYEGREWPVGDQACKMLVGSGLVYVRCQRGKKYFGLDNRHPAFNEVLNVLSELSPRPRGKQPAISQPRETHSISPRYPLTHHGESVNFRTILYVTNSGSEGITLNALQRKMPDQWPAAVQNAVGRLRNDGALDVQGNKIRLSPGVPRAFPRLVLRIALHLAKQDERFSTGRISAPHGVAAYATSIDDAPRLFGTDRRLRGLMALAKYGPLHLADLRNVIGGDQIRTEDLGNAPFGRAGFVRVWDEPDGRAAALDVAFPLAKALSKLLLGVERQYPLPPLARRYQVHKVPLKRKWTGNIMSVFGSPIPTGILFSVAVLGWTFEALCVAVCVGHHRENVKKALHRLENEGVLKPDRERHPGFNVRILRISDEFPAKTELNAMLSAATQVWPVVEGRTLHALRSLSKKTKIHLVNRGFLSARILAPTRSGTTKFKIQDKSRARLGSDEKVSGAR